MSVLVKGGRVVSPRGITSADILVENGMISGVGHFPGFLGKTIDASGKLVFPGFIDPHTHFDLETGGGVTADDFASGTRAAIAGGTTCIIDFVNHRKGETLGYALDRWHKKADGRCSCDYGFHMSFSQWNKSLAEEAETMPAHGITTFKAYMTYDWRMTDEQLMEIMLCLKNFGGLLGVHCEMGRKIDGNIAALRKQGHLSPDYHPLSRPPSVEAAAVHRVCDLAQMAGVKVVIVHLSSREGLLAAQGRHSAVIETCPQYLLLDESLYSLPEHEAQKYICSPPLRSDADREALWGAVTDGTISTVATDHCSFTQKQKSAGDGDFTKAPNGMPGVQTRPELIWSKGVADGRITPERMCSILAENPAKIYGLFPQKGVIAPGSDADLVIWDPAKRETISAKTQLSAADYCPYEGVEVTGAPETVMLRGIVVAQSGKIVNEKLGQFTPRGLPEV